MSEPLTAHFAAGLKVASNSISIGEGPQHAFLAREYRMSGRTACLVMHAGSTVYFDHNPMHGLVYLCAEGRQSYNGPCMNNLLFSNMFHHYSLSH